MSLSASGIIQIINQHRLRVFRTADILTLTGLARAAASQALDRLSDKKILARIKRGVWVNRLLNDINPYEAVPYLRTPWPTYVSLYSVLADAGVVEEVPQIIYAVYPGQPCRYRTPIGRFHVHHLPAHLIWGYEMKKIGEGSFPVADPEKAFLDLVYLALTPRSPLGFPHKRGRRWDLNKEKLKTYASRFKYDPLVAYLKEKNLW